MGKVATLILLAICLNWDSQNRLTTADSLSERTFTCCTNNPDSSVFDPRIFRVNPQLICPEQCADPKSMNQLLVKPAYDNNHLDSTGPVIVPFDGALKDGVTYIARVHYDKVLGLWPVVPLKIPLHTAKRIEWVNLRDFPQLKKLNNTSGEREVVFRVLSTQIVQMTSNRWNQTVRCLLL